MGYTHYHSALSRELEEDEIVRIKNMIFLSEVKICGGDGEGEPEVHSQSVWLNGEDNDNDDSHETFAVNLNDSGFCKTAYKPYDEVVVAILLYLESLEILTWSSDGNASDHKRGKQLLEVAMS